MIFDTKTKKEKKHTLILAVITIIYMLFIWIHSTMPADLSGEESATVLGFIDAIIKYFGLSVELTDHIIRKTAHFCEFALLGVLVLWNGKKINGKILNNLLSCSFICLATATIDETIQLFSPGRAGMVVDILLDFSGVIAGFIFYIIVYNLADFKRKRRKGV